MAASYLLTDIVQQIRDTINEPVARIFSASGVGSLNYFVDMGASVCSNLTFCKESTEDETCVGSQYVYSPSGQFIRIDSVSYVDVGTPDIEYGLQRIRPEVYGNVVAITEARPLYYFIHGNDNTKKVYVLPAPTSAMATAVDLIRIKGVIRAVNYGGSGAETLVDALQYVPYYYAMSCVYTRLGKHSLAALNMQKFIHECNQYKSEIRGTQDRIDSHDMARIPDITVPIS